MGEQLVTSILGGLLLGLADALVVYARTGHSARPHAPFGWMTTSLVALYLPPAMLIGLAAGVMLAVIRRTRWLDAWRMRLGRPSQLFRADPSGFAHALGVVVAGALLFVALDRATIYFTSHYHDPMLTASALAALSLGLVVAAVLLVATIATLLTPLVRPFGRVAAPGFVIVGTLVGTLIAALIYADVHRLFEVMDPIALFWGPIGVGTYLFAAFVVRFVVRRARALRVWAAAAVATAAALGLFSVCAAHYQTSQRARALVEDRSILGQRLVRTYLSLTDRDGDGYSFAFGGGDCNDSNPHIHPGALDRAGDGVDMDCFAGDGSPNVEPRGNGGYGWPAGSPPLSIVLVSIDALRGDHLGVGGYARATSPHIDAFARTAVRFDRTIAQSSRSLRSIPAMMTGFDPSQIAYGPEYLWPTVEPDNITVAELLSEHGYDTAATMGTNYFDRIGGFFQGFGDAYQFPIYKPARNEPIDHGLEQLERLAHGPKPFFLWIHLFNVHGPYLPDGAPSRFDSEPMGQYDTEIFLADEQFQRVLDAVDRLDLGNRTAVILASDHGEAFGEHGNHGHCFTLYEEELHATLIVRAPGARPGVVHGRIPLFDLGPTLLDFAHVPVTRPMPARSLVPLITGTGHEDPDRPIFSELMPDGMFPFDVKSLHQRDWKLMWWVRENRTELYDLRRDPGEHADLSDEHADVAARMVGTVRAWIAQTNRPANRDDDAIARARLPAPPMVMTARLDARWDSFTFLGYDLPRRTYHPAERIPLVLYFRADETTQRNYRFEVYFQPPPGFEMPPHFHAGHYPLNGRYFTNQWRAGEVLRDEAEMVVPHDIPHPVHLLMKMAVRDADGPEVDVPNRTGETVLDLGPIDIE